MKYVVETRMINSWENTWSEDDEPLVFNSKAEAKVALSELAEEMPDFDPSEYRIVKLTGT